MLEVGASGESSSDVRAQAAMTVVSELLRAGSYLALQVQSSILQVTCTQLVTPLTGRVKTASGQQCLRQTEFFTEYDKNTTVPALIIVQHLSH